MWLYRLAIVLNGLIFPICNRQHFQIVRDGSGALLKNMQTDEDVMRVQQFASYSVIIDALGNVSLIRKEYYPTAQVNLENIKNPFGHTISIARNDIRESRKFNQTFSSDGLLKLNVPGAKYGNVEIYVDEALQIPSVGSTEQHAPEDAIIVIPDGQKTLDDMVLEQQRLAIEAEQVEKEAALKNKNTPILDMVARIADRPIECADPKYPDKITNGSGRAYALEKGLHAAAGKMAGIGIGSALAAVGLGVAAFFCPPCGAALTGATGVVGQQIATAGAVVWGTLSGIGSGAAAGTTGASAAAAAIGSVPLTVATALPAKLSPKIQLGPTAKAYHAIFARLGLGYWRNAKQPWTAPAYVLFENYTNFALRVSFRRSTSREYIFYMSPQEKNVLRGIGLYGIKMVRIEPVAEYAMLNPTSTSGEDKKLVPVLLENRKVPDAIFARRAGVKMVSRYLVGLVPYVNEVIATKIFFNDGKIYLKDSKGIVQDNQLFWEGPAYRESEFKSDVNDAV